MLMSTKANRYAHQLLKSRAAGTLLPTLSDEISLSLDDAYDIARSKIHQVEELARENEFPLKLSMEPEDG